MLTNSFEQLLYGVLVEYLLILDALIVINVEYGEMVLFQGQQLGFRESIHLWVIDTGKGHACTFTADLVRQHDMTYELLNRVIDAALEGLSALDKMIHFEPNLV